MTPNAALNHLQEALSALCQRRTLPVLIVVSKTQPVSAIEALLEAGHRDFGENYVQEALAKWPALKQRYPDCRLHGIGILQRNKLKEALSIFDVLHTVDRPSLLTALSRLRAQGVTLPDLFFQVNTGEESQKGGVLLNALEGLHQQAVLEQRLPMIGLMSIPPAAAAPAPHFALLHKLAKRYDLPCLSMGMSRDWETAVRCGATHLRLGTAIFGAR
jgi:PLP dependent protein